MGVFTFVCRSSGKEWTAKQMNGDLEESAASTYDLQRKCVQSALSADSSGGVQSSFSYVTPSSGVFQVLLFFCLIAQKILSFQTCKAFEICWISQQMDGIRYFLSCPF